MCKAFKNLLNLKKTSGQEPSVVSLQIHLPNQQCIVFNPYQNPDDIIERAENADIPLTAFFKINQLPGPIGDLTCTLTYQQFPNNFII